MPRSRRAAGAFRLTCCFGQYDVALGYPAQERSSYALYQLRRSDLARPQIARWVRLSWRCAPCGRTLFHPTAITRPQAAAPLRDYLRRCVLPPPGPVLYYGVGRDLAGAQALSRGGRVAVTSYDPFHPAAAVRRLPHGTFSEVHCHYVLNIVDRATGRRILRHLHHLVRPGGLVLISVRRDLSEESGKNGRLGEAHLII